MPSVLLTIPDEVVEKFINHLGKFSPELAKHVTLRVLSDDHAQEIINDFDFFQKLEIPEVIDFPLDFPDDEWDDDLVPLEDIIDSHYQHHSDLYPD
jgi:hypothetical protein